MAFTPLFSFSYGTAPDCWGCGGLCERYGAGSIANAMLKETGGFFEGHIEKNQLERMNTGKAGKQKIIKQKLEAVLQNPRLKNRKAVISIQSPSA